MEQQPYLSGVPVIDFSMLAPGAFCSQILADLGATVLKVERPVTGDLERVTAADYFRAFRAPELGEDTEHVIAHGWDDLRERLAGR